MKGVSLSEFDAQLACRHVVDAEAQKEPLGPLKKNPEVLANAHLSPIAPKTALTTSIDARARSWCCSAKGIVSYMR